MLNLFVTRIRPKLEYGSMFIEYGLCRLLQLLKRIQRRWTEAVDGMEQLPYAERLNRLKLFSFEGRLL